MKHMKKAENARWRKGKTSASAPMSPREKRRFLQLAASLFLFLLMFLGTKIMPDRLASWENYLSGDTDFVAAFSTVGQSISDGEDVGTVLRSIWLAISGQDSGGDASSTLVDFSRYPSFTERMSQVEAPIDAGAVLTAAEQTAQGSSSPALVLASSLTPDEPETQTVAAQTTDEAGRALPDGVTTFRYSLGLTDTVTPVTGTVTSPFGFRVRTGQTEETFHQGLDIAADEGTPVLSFAAGTVEAVGENDSCGLYVKLSHANDVETFYAHCSKILVSSGQNVSAGQIIASVGSTGNATGPHLHFAIVKDGIRLDPSYYIRTASE